MKEFEKEAARTLPLAPDFQGVKLISFDFFDTLVYRDSISHFQLWKRVSKRFYFSRLLAETCARLKTRLMRIPEITQSDLDRLMPKHWRTEFEIRLELDTLVANPVIIRVLQEALDSGIEVCIISDTHYKEEVIKVFMEKLEIPNVRVFTSSDHLRTKSTGLFDVVHKALNIDFNAWVHIGDNLKSDVSTAQAHGITAFHYPGIESQLIKSGIINRDAIRFLKRAGVPGNLALSELFSVFLAAELNTNDVPVAGPEILGMVFGSGIAGSIASAIHEMHLKSEFDLILYSSRDGWIPFIKHKSLFPGDPIQYFKTSRKMLKDEKYKDYLASIVGGSQRVLIYDLGWRGSTSKKISADFPAISWSFVYWQFLGKKQENQTELNPAHFRNRLRVWRSRDFLESVFTDESNGYDQIGDNLDPIERAHDGSIAFKKPILAGALSVSASKPKTDSLIVTSLILESFCHFPSIELIKHAEGAFHEISEKRAGQLVATSWKTLLNPSPIQWPFGSRLVHTKNPINRYAFTVVVLLKEAGQRFRNLFGRLIKSNQEI
jgi:FMN phosphatase YigB (HAD superfamily)